jgi:hypothetical protein
MLKALMDKIAYFEKELDKDVEASGKRKLSESSFSPCGYPPREKKKETERRSNAHPISWKMMNSICHVITSRSSEAQAQGGMFCRFSAYIFNIIY